MPYEAGTRDQRILDARMEYGLLMGTYLSLAQMMWVGYGAFFTINTLLATGLGFSYSNSSGVLDKWLLKIIHILIPITGIVISIIAIYAAKEIASLRRLANLRGRELETLLFAKTFLELQSYSEKKPTATAIGSLLFFTLWLTALVRAY